MTSEDIQPVQRNEERRQRSEHRRSIKGSEIPSDTIIGDADYLGEWLGLEKITIRELMKHGRLVKVGPDKYDVKASVRAYCKHQRETIQSYGPKNKAPLTESQAEAKTAQIKIKTDLDSIKIARLRGDLVPLTDVTEGWAHIVKTVRGSLLNVHSTIAMRLGLSKTQTVAVKQIIADILDMISRERVGHGTDHH